MIDGKLVEMGHDPHNVQAIVATNPRGRETLSLRDVDGVFVDSGTLEEPERHGTGDGGCEDRGDEPRDGFGDEGERPRTDSTASETSAEGELADLRFQNAVLSACTTELREQVSSLNEEVTRLNEMLKRETERVVEMWKMNCAQVIGFDEAITTKDSEIEALKAKVAELQTSLGRRPMGSTSVPARASSARPRGSVETSAHVELAPVVTPGTHASVPARRGKAPPVKKFNGEDPDCLLEDWLPSLEWAGTWNAWSEEDRMIQLAGHLKGKALQEWNLLHPDQRATFTQAIEALRPIHTTDLT